GVGLDADAGAERARINCHGVERRPRDGAEAWIGPVLWIAVVAVELGRALAEIRIVAGRRIAVVPRHAVAQARCIDLDFVRKRIERGRLDEIAAGDEAAQAPPAG